MTSELADQTSGAGMIVNGAQSWNQNACSLTISSSSVLKAHVGGAVALTVTAALAPGATSVGRANRWSLSQVVMPDLNCAG